VGGSVWQFVAVCGSGWQCVAVCGSVWQCVAVCGSVWQCVAVCGSVFSNCISGASPRPAGFPCCSVLRSVW